MRREQRILKERLALQRQLIEELDPEKFFARKGRDTYAQMLAKQKEPQVYGYCTPWDEYHRLYERDVESGGTTFTEQANALARQVADAILAGETPYGRLMTYSVGMLDRFHIDIHRFPQMGILELSVFLYAVLHGYVKMNYYGRPRPNPFKHDHGRTEYKTENVIVQRGRKKGYRHPDMTDRVIRDRSMYGRKPRYR